LFSIVIAQSVQLLQQLIHCLFIHSRIPLTSEALRYYHWYELWFAKANRVYGRLLFPAAQVILIILSTLGVVGSIKYDGVVRLMVSNIGAMAYIILYVVLRLSSMSNSRSLAAIQRWKSEAFNAHERRAVRALRPLRIYIGTYCFVDMCLILTTTNMIIDNSISILLLEEG